MSMTVVFERIPRWGRILIRLLIKRRTPVYILEHFYSYHHKDRKEVRFLTHNPPSFIGPLIDKNAVSVISAASIQANNIYALAADRAVEIIESVYPVYRKKHAKLIQFLAKALNSSFVEDCFKKNLCNTLAEFFSMNITLQRVCAVLKLSSFVFYPAMNAEVYYTVQKILDRRGEYFFSHPNIQFSRGIYLMNVLVNALENGRDRVRILAQIIGAAFLGWRTRFKNSKKQFYKYGVAIIGPHQLQDSQRRADFLIDDKYIDPADVVYFPLIPLSDDQKRVVESLPGRVYYLPRVGRFFSNIIAWLTIAGLSMTRSLFKNGEELRMACRILFEYYRWQYALQQLHLGHFLSKCDFGYPHIARDIALQQGGVQTWYFHDSMNFGCNYQGMAGEVRMRHPFWSYLHYDNLVTWTEFMRKYHQAHPGFIQKSHVVGCLWSEHIKPKQIMQKQKATLLFTIPENHFVVVAFDSTYTRNSITSYAEGIAFAQSLLRLVNDLPTVYLIVKEKKTKHFYLWCDPILGPRLVDLYETMAQHPRILFLPIHTDSAGLISIADVVISFPFTSPTFEALSVNRPAIWHDPFGYYRNTPYAKVPGLTTHSYAELEARVRAFMQMKPGEYRNPLPIDSPLSDPYRDGKAIERFRELLCKS